MRKFLSEYFFGMQTRDHYLYEEHFYRAFETDPEVLEPLVRKLRRSSLHSRLFGPLMANLGDVAAVAYGLAEQSWRTTISGLCIAEAYRLGVTGITRFAKRKNARLRERRRNSECSPHSLKELLLLYDIWDKNLKECDR